MYFDEGKLYILNMLTPIHDHNIFNMYTQQYTIFNLLPNVMKTNIDIYNRHMYTIMENAIVCLDVCLYRANDIFYIKLSVLNR